jgi:hypothetical protein
LFTRRPRNFGGRVLLCADPDEARAMALIRAVLLRRRPFAPYRRTRKGAARERRERKKAKARDRARHRRQQKLKEEGATLTQP